MAVFDITMRNTFEDLRSVVDAISRVKDCHILEIPFVVVGNKLDLETQREVLTQEAQDWATSIGAGYIETSALNQIHIQEAFEMMVRRIRYQRSVSFFFTT